MKPTKARLRNYVDTLKNSVEKEIREKKTKAIRAHIESEWLKIDPEFEKLHRYFSSLRIRQNVKNELVDLLEENSLEIWSFYRDTDARDFETYKKGFLEKLKYNSIKGLAKVE
ncbi:TPA: hypothetical protein KL282_003114, partial [Enterococcus faecalis]|nr:hypothetical protein [Enterococcus faecalis]